MDIKSLMVGDWVYNTNNRQNERVQEIGSGLVMLNYNDLYEFDEIEPIPLTTDILEKNGFTDVINPPYKERVLHHVIDGYCVEINVVNKDANMIITPLAERTLVRRRVDFILPNPDYVHELQHALRLCGINKEIEL